MMNTICLQGRLTRSPEVRRTDSGLVVANFSIACERDFANADGVRETDFLDIVAWRSTAEFVEKYFHKGSLIALTGRLQIRTWTDKEGSKRKSAEIVADHVYFCERKVDNLGLQTGNFEVVDDDSELPF